MDAMEKLLGDCPQIKEVALRELGEGPLQSECSLPQRDSEPATEEREVEARQIYTIMHEIIEETGHESLVDEKRILGKWFWLSNAFFVLGSLFYVWYSISDVIDTYNEDDSADDDTANDTWCYKALRSAGALFYLANSIVDLRVSIVEIQGNIGSGRFGDDPSWEVGVACTFGLAAICDLIGELIWDEDWPEPGYAAGSAAVHVYLLNALLVISGRIPRFSSLPKALMSAGDILFLVGSVIDVLISYIDNPKTPPSWFGLIAWSALFSSLLWFTDSILYVLAELLDTGESVSGDESIDDYFEFGSTISCEGESPFHSCGAITNTEQKLELL